MSQNLHTQAVAALGELYLLTLVQELQDISLEQLEQAQWARTGLFIACYLYLAQLCKESLDVATCNYKCSNQQTRHFQTRNNCN